MEEETKTDIEMKVMSNGNDGAARVVNGQDAAPDEPDLGRRRNVPGTETEMLLGDDVTANGNTVAVDSNHDTEAQNPPSYEQKKSAVCQVKKELTQKVCKRVPLWAVLILILVLIVAVIFVSLALCTVIYEDVDEKYDRMLFNVHRKLSGSFQLPNLNFTEELLHMNSSEGQMLAAELENKLDDLYRNSPALGRYYSTSEVYDFSDDPVTAWFRLTFLMPAAEGGQLTRFTLSRGLVYNVLRQFLFEQEDPSEPTFIQPASLNMTEYS